MAVVGIDLGTTNSLVATWRDGRSELIPNAYGSYLTPSVVTIGEYGPVVGAPAVACLVTHPERTCARFKRLMGSGEIVKLAGRSYTPEQLSACVLRQLVEDAEAYLGEPVTEAVVSVPAYFDIAQRVATKRAAEIAGIRVSRLVNEPSAAALANHDLEREETFIVFDFGGGTLDVSVVDCFENVVNTCAISGDNQLGGIDFDAVIAQELSAINGQIHPDPGTPLYEELRLVAEQAKRRLDTIEAETDVSIQTPGYDRALHLTCRRLYELSSNIFKRMSIPLKRALGDAGFEPEEITALVMVGGSSHMPVVRRFLMAAMNVPVTSDDQCDCAVALGLGIYVGIMQRSEGVRDILLSDVCPFSLSTSLGDFGTRSMRTSFLIKRNTRLPAQGELTYYAPGESKFVTFDIYQGESIYPQYNKQLTELSIKVGASKDKYRSCSAKLFYDINCLLALELHVKDCGVVARYVYEGKSWRRLKPGEEHAQLRATASEIKLDSTNTEYRLATKRAEDLFDMLGNEDAQLVLKNAFDEFRSNALKGGSVRRIRERIEEFHRLMDMVESDTGADAFFTARDAAQWGVDWMDPNSWHVDDDSDDQVEQDEGGEIADVPDLGEEDGSEPEEEEGMSS